MSEIAKLFLGFCLSILVSFATSYFTVTNRLSVVETKLDDILKMQEKMFDKIYK
jgi:flagellar biosynthesis protein FliR